MIFVVLGLLAAYAVFFHRVYSYRLSPTGLEVRWLGIRVVRWRYEDVEWVRVISFRESMNFGMRTRRLGNRFSGPVVAVRRRSGWVRDMLLTPDNADAFARELNLKGKVGTSND